MTIKPPKVKLPTVKCEYCGYEWTPKQSGRTPRRCPQCTKYRWWLPQKNKEVTNK